MNSSKILKIRPFARLLTMLGDQLIKNERIALIELIKNSYDADSSWVKLSFNGFGENYEIKADSKIIIEDAGEGMTRDIIENHWLNPATPVKHQRKKIKDTTPKGRVIQGEKGIGRFAMFKLGSEIKVITRPLGENVEYILHYDFSRYDHEFLTEEGKDKNLFIDDLTVTLHTRKPEIIQSSTITLGINKLKRPPHGTRIEISGLKGSWSETKVHNIYHDVARLKSIFVGTKVDKTKIKSDFDVWIYKNNIRQKYQEDYLDKLNLLLEDRSVFSIEDGVYDEKNKEFRFTINGEAKKLGLRDPNLTGLSVFREYFGTAGKVLDKRTTECGSFHFAFFIFDFSANAPLKYNLDKADKQILREHRIYLYRDGIRVYPYGDPDDDWLRIDAYRGTISAGYFLSNDQVVGYVNITQKDNPKLKDKTNREGLIEEDNATADFIKLIQVFLAYIRQKPYARHRKDLENKKVQDIFKRESVQEKFENLKEATLENKKAQALIAKAVKEYKAERQFLVQRAETTEELAGVGLSVETASHDIMAIMGRAMMSIDALIGDMLHKNDLNHDELQKELQSLRGMLSFIEAQLKDVQLLFKSSKQRRKNIRVKNIIEKVERIYRRLLKKEVIEFSIQEIGSPLVAKTTDAVLLQLLLNLFDNAVYWLQQISSKGKRIEIVLDGNKGQMIFSDNGPGVAKDDAPYIFEPFYSGKGDEGRGLGLYIARQLLERNDYTIELAELRSEKKLPGANFVVNFVATED